MKINIIERIALAKRDCLKEFGEAKILLMSREAWFEFNEFCRRNFARHSISTYKAETNKLSTIDGMHIIVLPSTLKILSKFHLYLSTFDVQCLPSERITAERG